MSFSVPKVVNQVAPYQMAAGDLGGAYVREGLTANTTDDFPSVADMSSSFSILGGGVQWAFSIHNPTAYDLTLQGDANTTFNGTNVVSAGTSRMFFASSASQGATDMAVDSVVSCPCAA